MKTNVKNKWLIILALIFFLIVLFPMAQGIVRADTQILESDMNDGNLYAKLLKQGGGLLRSETFNKEKYNTITLQGVTTSNTDSNIVDLSGLMLFKFEYTTKLDLSNNNIQEISAEVLNVFPNLEELVLTNNNIRSIDISSCYNLKKLIIDNNELTGIDLSELNPNGAEVDLSCNYISSINHIKLPSQTVKVNTKIDLYNNNIVDFEKSAEGYTMNLGLQGFNSKNGVIEKKQTAAYYKTNDDQNLKIVISEGDTVKYELSNNTIDKDKVAIALDNGSYSISYYYTGDDKEEIISTKGFTVRKGDDYYKDFFRYYKYSEFTVNPSRPTYTYVVGDKEYRQDELTKITKKSTIKVQGDEDSTIMYSISGGEWQEGNEIQLTRGGRYTINIKAVSQDGKYSSENVTIFITASANLTLPDVLIVMLIIIGAVVIFGVGFPLLRKYVL